MSKNAFECNGPHSIFFITETDSTLIDKNLRCGILTEFAKLTRMILNSWNYCPLINIRVLNFLLEIKLFHGKLFKILNV